MTIEQAVLGRRLLLAAALGALAGCEQLFKSKKAEADDEDESEDDEPKKKKKKKKKDADEEDVEKKAAKADPKPEAKPEPAKPAEPTPEKATRAQLDKIAFFLGRKWGFACTFAALGAEPEVDASLKEAKIMADGLDVPLPGRPNKKNGIDAMRGSELLNAVNKKHGLRTASAYWAGLSVTDASFGAGLGVDISKQLDDVALASGKAGVPEGVYKGKVADAKRAPKNKQAEPVKALAGALESHFRSV